MMLKVRISMISDIQQVIQTTVTNHGVVYGYLVWKFYLNILELRKKRFTILRTPLDTLVLTANKRLTRQLDSVNQIRKQRCIFYVTVQHLVKQCTYILPILEQLSNFLRVYISKDMDGVQHMDGFSWQPGWSSTLLTSDTQYERSTILQ